MPHTCAFFSTSNSSAQPKTTSPTAKACPPILILVEAGFLSLADDYMEGKLDLHKHLVRNEAATFFLRAHGESMLGAGIHDGELLVVDGSLKEKGMSRLLDISDHVLPNWENVIARECKPWDRDSLLATENFLSS